MAGELSNSVQNEFNRAVQRCLLELRAAVGLDLFDFFAFCDTNGLPSFFEPSFLQPRIEKERLNLPSQNLVAEPDPFSVYPADLLTNPEELSKLKLEKEECLELTLYDIDNVPVPKDSGQSSGHFNLEDVKSREVRLVLFDFEKNEYVSNTYILPATGSVEGKRWSFDAAECVDMARYLGLKVDPDR